MSLRRRRCDACKFDVARSWFARHQASNCTVARGVAPKPRFWLDSNLRLRPIATLARDQHYYGVRTLRPQVKRRFEPV